MSGRKINMSSPNFMDIWKPIVILIEPTKDEKLILGEIFEGVVKNCLYFASFFH